MRRWRSRRARTGKLFLEFALTLAGAVVVSGFVALTLTPMMCSKLLKHNDRPNIIARFIEAFPPAWSAYRGVLTFAIRPRYVVFLLALGVAGMGGVLFTVCSIPSSPRLRIAARPPDLGPTRRLDDRLHRPTTPQVEASLPDRPRSAPISSPSASRK
jgi:hypothetical protein